MNQIPFLDLGGKERSIEVSLVGTLARVTGGHGNGPRNRLEPEIGFDGGDD